MILVPPSSIISQLTESEIGEIQRVDQTIRHVLTQKLLTLNFNLNLAKVPYGHPYGHGQFIRWRLNLSGAVDHSTLKQS